MIKKKTEAVIKSREAEKKKADWYDQRKSYTVYMAKDDFTPVIADSYTLGGFPEQEYLIFFVKLGDELVEVARFKEWLSVNLDIDCLYK
jgi:hypothetical protein